ncbi:MAG: methylenetetrahydrofolate--tRNA-(uracil(54)-C(5))-methyltransferase (FADH(2)-oxidizing) TrmFO [Bdellovibrionales bacterium]|nr:methylenetetrahydrofolate--tRNA-(uracil(54)-C(5))-methyltransferase (FADH(2)-oxidizing) TrmFO [Bdellovibrionales bacterium]
MRHLVTIIGGGLAGCEAAMMLSRFGINVRLFEMKPKKYSPAHKLATLGELVCSNSLGSTLPNSAPGLLKAEMQDLHSVVLEAGYESMVPAGNALGVDRDRFSKFIQQKVEMNPLVEIRHEECQSLPKDSHVIVATGPLTSDALAGDLTQKIGEDTLYFYDSISPIVSAESIDFSKTFFANRYAEDSEDYLNCPMDQTLYETFVKEIISSEKVPVKSFEALKCFEACLPIEVLAERGMRTLSFGPMKPVGLTNPHDDRPPYAVVQMRRENDPTTLYNLVGFQTRMKWGDQKRIFRMIPGLQNAEFVRFGSMHRNTYIESPKILDAHLTLKNDSKIAFAGQITGVEGYVESAAMGQWAALSMASKILLGQPCPLPPSDSAMGGLIRSITQKPLHGLFSPTNINFGLLPPIISQKKIKKEDRRRQMVERARTSFSAWIAGLDESLRKTFENKTIKRSHVG